MTFSVEESYGFIVPVCIAGMLWSIYNGYLVSLVKLDAGGDYSKINDEENGGVKV